MNIILDDYSAISESKLNSKRAYYGLNFFNQSINWLIPDVYAYIEKIFTCLRWAEQSREIIEDVCKQISECRKTQKRIINSIGYKMGTLYVDGRAYIQQNVHMYCQYISEINDCFCQILNIVYDLGYRQWSFLENKKILDGLKHYPQIKKLCNNFYSTIRVYKEFDNFAKHNLFLFGKEKFLAEYFLNIEYYFELYGKPFKMSDFINMEAERRIKICIIELLDNIFDSIDKNMYSTRKYVQLQFDAKITPETILSIDEVFLPDSCFVTMRYKTKLKNGIRYTESISYDCGNSKPMDELYLALLNQRKSSVGNDTVQRELDTVGFNELDVIQDNVIIG